ncbi:N-acetylglucosamine-6-phosphate deacetylase [uncultured Ruminococcus sp.]|uniref:N-acetylglucosamine-6-phosphate deacetylase n=1 Tax=Massiliimalia timonensis TaxID=1987501 RepID=UPI000820DC89|nr:N-acetylglucosamine-6-phosphate deacetylase [Massiliimalia timonensis]SCH16462.1 N-acetylglucosamine-6-phosphate deacetylase [uncultured Ruminococcus sp.]SCH23076.1 N-acetylglucosamine-6-phosphate deacetylase [uncultured Clostridium sp.]
MLFQHGTVFYQSQFRQIDVRVENGKITEAAAHLEGTETIDCTGKLLLPGLVDIHSHGCMGSDFSTAQPQEMEKMLQYYQSWGITSVCPTTITMSPEGCKRAVTNLAQVNSLSPSGSRMLGINLEGPFLNPAKKGAHDERFLIPPDLELLDELDKLSGGLLRIIDIDPTLAGADQVIERYHQEKTISLAHTPCTYDQAIEAFDRGADHITHLFNAMNGLHHRDPGLVGALGDRDVFAELICDGIHIHPSVIRLIFRACAPKLAIISDSMCACGLTDGTYELGGLTVTVTGRKAALADGTIAGSVTNVYQGMCNAIRFGVPAEQAILSASLIPAKSIGADQEYGSIEPGKYADLLLVQPDYQLEHVYQAGKLVK